MRMLCDGKRELNGILECDRRKRQIEQGRLRPENGLTAGDWCEEAAEVPQAAWDRLGK